LIGCLKKCDQLPQGSDNKLICTLNDARVPDHAKAIGNTRSAAAVDFWDSLEGSIVVVGNAPTALFKLLERIQEGAPKPALVIGIPVGFIGAVESKQALSQNTLWHVIWCGYRHFDENARR